MASVMNGKLSEAVPAGYCDRTSATPISYIVSVLPACGTLSRLKSLS